MAKKHFLVIEDSFIGMSLIKADDKRVVEIETDIDAGGMTPGANLVEVEDDGKGGWTPVAMKKPKASKADKEAAEKAAAEKAAAEKKADDFS